MRLSIPGLNALHTLELTVLRSVRVVPHLQRVTLTGSALRRITRRGGDQRCRVVVNSPVEDQARWMPATIGDPWSAAAQFSFFEGMYRPVTRMVPVRAFRPGVLEADIDIALDTDALLSTWACMISPGSRIRIIDCGCSYRAPDHAHWQVLVAEDSGVPAALAVAESTPSSTPTTAFLEVPTHDDTAHIPLGDNITVVWLPRDNSHLAPGLRVLQMLRDEGLSLMPDRVFVAGGRPLVAKVRRTLMADGVPRSVITGSVYAAPYAESH
ncbi:MAG: siderophore-interacting protein [Acidipropionibacterium sp.]|nr:siderophore-interacting protein [Acidipropionibacterium sp.]